MRLATALVLTLLASCGGNSTEAQERYITLASTTSTKNSGLFDHVLPGFTKQSGIEVRVVAVGTGQAIRLAERGDADVLLVHHKPSEERFVALGYGVRRHDVMYNDFVLLGPAADPAGVRGTRAAIAALKRIAKTRAPFVSRGDDSGTHKKECSLWAEAAVDVRAASGSWYREAGAGMGATINIAVGMQAYTLADRATWLASRNRGDLAIVYEGDKRLFNQYGVIAVNPRKHPHVRAADSEAFVAWLTSEAGQRAIATFRVGGLQVFFPNARAGS